MMEKESTYRSFEKKIIPYLDGALTPEELSEFEAFVFTHPEFEKTVKNKQAEVSSIKKMIPSHQASQEVISSINQEFRTSIFNLLKDEPRGFRDLIAQKWEEWQSR